MSGPIGKTAVLVACQFSCRHHSECGQLRQIFCIVDNQKRIVEHDVSDGKIHIVDDGADHSSVQFYRVIAADGAVYQYYTTLKGAMEKEDPDNWEFVVPAKLKQLYEAKDYGRYAMKNGEMPVCFIVDTDNTGGNSGSPVFNGKGQLIGTGFDRNYEGLTGDIAFRPSSQRAACVDIRYTLFIIEKYAGASHIIKEMDISD